MGTGSRWSRELARWIGVGSQGVRETWISQEMSGEESGVALHGEIENCLDERPNQIF